MGCGSRWCASWTRIVSGAVLAVIPLGFTWVAIGTPVQLSNTGSNPAPPNSRPVLVAIGDSFMSGEGTDVYLPGTATANNLCHRSALAYPPQIAEALGMRLVFGACSGATSRDVLGNESPESPGQYPASPKDVPGAHPQIDLLSKSAVHTSVDEVGIVLLSIGGNDANFGDIVRTCLVTNCEPMWSSWMEGLERAGQQIGDVHKAIARTVAKGTRVLVTLYPAPIVPAECGALGEQLTKSELAWVLDTFLTRLNYVIQFWATIHGFEVVDLSRTFEGVRICEVPYGQAAATVFNLRRNDIRAVRELLGSSAQGSFHPNVLGHNRMKAEILAKLGQPPDPGNHPPFFPIVAPPVDSAPGPPNAGLIGPPIGPPMTPPPHVPPGIGVPVGEPVPAGLTCRGIREEFTNVVPIRPRGRSYRLVADPGSAVCYRAEHGDWVESVVPANGIFPIPLRAMNESGRPIEVWFSSDSRTRKVALVPQFDVPAHAVAIGRSVTLWLTGAIGLMALAFGHQVYCFRCRRRMRAAP
jgi:hypothetical protein